MAKVRPVSQDLATSCPANESGKNTERIPCVSHLRGNIAAICCIQGGSWVKIKKTPLKNCKMITMGETTADAPRPLFGTIENAIPSDVEHALPSKSNQVKVIHLLISVGMSTPKKINPNPKSMSICITILTETNIAFPIK